MAGRLAGKVAAITGGNQGIGLGIAQRFIADGASVSICYLSYAAGTQKVVDGLKANGGNAIAVQCDVSKIPDGERFIAETERQLGRVGRGRDGPLFLLGLFRSERLQLHAVEG